MQLSFAIMCCLYYYILIMNYHNYSSNNLLPRWKLILPNRSKMVFLFLNINVFSLLYFKLVHVMYFFLFITTYSINYRGPFFSKKVLSTVYNAVWCVGKKMYQEFLKRAYPFNGYKMVRKQTFRECMNSNIKK